MAHARNINSVARGPLRPRQRWHALCLALILAAPSAPVQAFEIFGFKLFEKEEAETVQVADPLSYSVQIEVSGADPEGALRAELEAAWTDVNMKSAKHKKGTR